MYIEKKYQFDIPIEHVWNGLTNVEALATCIPGCERCEKIDDTTYSATVKAKVSFITAEFKGKVTLAKVEPPSFMEVHITGQDSKLGSLMNARNRLQLRVISPTETEIICSMDASVGGRLGALGASVIRAKAEETLDQTIQNAKLKLLA